MARGKKKESALTPEEKLVPEGEQPYKVPENWCWTTLRSVSDIIMGQSPAGTDTTDDPSYMPLIGGAADMGQLFPKATRFTKVPTKKSRMDDLILCIRATLGRPIYSDGVYCLGRGVAAIRSTILSKEFLRFYFVDQEQYLYDHATGTTFAQVNSDVLSNMPIALPPSAEQQRIVDRIEYLFAKLDKAKEKAQAVLDSFETRKAAILHKAFTGELTAKWRVTQGIGMDSWKESTVGNVCHEVKVGIVIKPSQYYTDAENGTPAFRSANVRENRIDDFDWVYLNQTGMESNKRSIVHTGDVLVVRSGNPGTACVVSEKFDGYNAIDILIAVPNQDYISSDFLCSYTNSPFGKNLVSEKKRGMALSHFNVKGYSALPIRVPTLPEQKEVIRILDSLLAKEQSAKEAAEAVLDKINLLKKSILARAFRGELRTNAPTDEPAIELLKRIL